MNDAPNQQFWIVDDDPFYSDALKEVVEGTLYGWMVQRFKNAAELHQALRDGKRPSAAVLDMMLPMDEADEKGGLPPDDGAVAPGVHLAQTLKDHGVKLDNIAVASALIQEKYHAPLLEIGIRKENILIKPSLIEDILRVVRRISGTNRGLQL